MINPFIIKDINKNDKIKLMIKIENMYEKFNFIIEDNTTFSIPFEAIKYSGTLMKYYQNNKPSLLINIPKNEKGKKNFDCPKR